MSQTVVIRNVKFRWAHVYNTHAPFGDNIWDVQVVTDSKDKADEMRSHGLNVKEKDGEFFANVKRKEMNAKGERNTPPDVVDEGRRPITDPIGNDSVGNIKLFTYDISKGPRKGSKGAMLSAIQVTEPYRIV